MNRILQVLPVFLLLAACGLSSDPDPVFNHFECRAGAQPHEDFLQALYDGTEDSLSAFYELLNEELGKPRVIFLHYTLDSWDEFFHPEKRRIDPEILASPFGVQKIMIWDSVSGFWGKDTTDISLQVEQKRAGPRVVDKVYCSIEVRIRHIGGKAGDWTTPEGEEVMGHFQQWLRQAAGPPHGSEPDTAWTQLSRRYNERSADWKRRVQPTLSGECYPPVSTQPGSPELKLQVCEVEGMKDTLVCKVVVLDSDGVELPMILVNNSTDSVVTRLMIYDGYLGYSIFTEDPSLVDEIRFLLPDGRQIIFYEQGDFTRDLMPFRFRPPEKEQAQPPANAEELENTVRTL